MAILSKWFSADLIDFFEEAEKVTLEENKATLTFSLDTKVVRLETLKKQLLEVLDMLYLEEYDVCVHCNKTDNTIVISK